MFHKTFIASALRVLGIIFKFIVMSMSQFHLNIRHLPGAVSVVNCDMSHLPSLPTLENVFHHILWISAVSFSCHKLHTLSVSIRGVEPGLTSLGSGEGHDTKENISTVRWKYSRSVPGQDGRRMGLVEAFIS